MPTTHPLSSSARERRARASEAGFTLIEMVVVAIIIVILTALAIATFGGTKKTTTFKAAQAAATTYAEVIEAYMADNGQVPPTMGSSTWPSTPRATRIGGPRDVMLKDTQGNPKRYMSRAAPEAVSDGFVDLIAAGIAPTGTPRATITYRVVGANYELLVQTVPKPGDAPFVCIVTNGPTLPAGVKRCA